MRLLVLVGLPNPLSKRLLKALRESASLRAGWVIETIDSKDARRASVSLAQGLEAMRRAAASEHAHIVGVSTEAGHARQLVAQSVRVFFRFRWLDNTQLPHITSNTVEFITRLNDVLAEEEYWAQHIKPKGLHDPLMLPKDCFRTVQPHGELWGRCEAYGNQQIAAAFVAGREAFARRYHQRSPGENNKYVQWWTDEDDRTFKHRGGKHGLAPFPRDWKYSVKLIDGFHYDVVHKESSSFAIQDCDGRNHSRSRGEHVNLDPHGVVRAS